jgi:hypothetical protein
MLSSLLRPRARRSTDTRRPLLFGRSLGADESSDESSDNNPREESRPDFLNPRRTLLPLFSAAHLGELDDLAALNQTDHLYRSYSCLPPPAQYPIAYCCKMREHVNMGSASNSSDISVPGQANSTGDSICTLEQGHTIRPSCQLSAIPERWADEPRRFGTEQNKSSHM